MNKIIIDEKYQFVPPREGRFFPALIGLLLPWVMKKDHGITSTHFYGLDKIAQAHEAGKAILLAPNHCRPVDPMVVALGARKAGCYIYTVASWHLFKQNRLQSFLLPRLGVFSIYREGMDRESLKCCVDTLATAARPLLLFPEGVINRTNDRLGEFLEGLGLVARLAAKARPDHEVLVFPVALRYIFEGDLESIILPVLDELESRLSWHPRRKNSIRERIDRLADALLTLKEIEYGCDPHAATVPERISNLIDRVLSPHEVMWLKSTRHGPAKARVKALRIAVMPILLKDGTPEETKNLIWDALRDVYLAQQLENYSTEYFSHNATRTQILETVEKFEEDLKDKVPPYPPIRATMTVCDPVKVTPEDKDQLKVVESVRHAIEETLAKSQMVHEESA